MRIESLKLVYFSPTGTTKKIIEEISKGINYSSTEVVDITKPEGRKRQLRTSENELLIIGAPVYFGRVQANAIEWLNTIKTYNTPTVCIVVYGNREYDDALLELKETAVKKGCIPIACAAYIGEHSFSNSKTPIAAGRPDADDLRHAQSFGENIRKKIVSIPAISSISDISVPGKYPYIDMIDHKNMLSKMLSSVDFVAVDSNCLHCGDCAQHCPVGAIDSENSASVDKSKCIVCHACIKNCPAIARTVKNDMIKNIAFRLSEILKVRKEPVFFL
jgi:ferredoxin